MLLPLPSRARGSEHVDLLVSPGRARDSERRLICGSLSASQARDSELWFLLLSHLHRPETQNKVSDALLLSHWTCRRL